MLAENGIPLLGLLDAHPETVQGFDPSEVLGTDDYLDKLDPASVWLVNAIGTVRVTRARSRVYDELKARSFEFLTLIHPRTILAATVRLSDGAQVMAGAVIQPNAFIGSNTILNTGVIIEHDCNIQAHVHIAPGSVVCGGVHVGGGSFIGAGAVLIQGIRIGDEVMIKAGAIVTRDVPDGEVFGNQQ